MEKYPLTRILILSFILLCVNEVTYTVDLGFDRSKVDCNHIIDNGVILNLPTSIIEKTLAIPKNLISLHDSSSVFTDYPLIDKTLSISDYRKRVLLDNENEIQDDLLI